MHNHSVHLAHIKYQQPYKKASNTYPIKLNTKTPPKLPTNYWKKGAQRVHPSTPNECMQDQETLTAFAIFQSLLELAQLAFFAFHLTSDGVKALARLAEISVRTYT